MCMWKAYADQELEATCILTTGCVQPPGDSTPVRGELYEVAVACVDEHGSLFRKCVLASCFPCFNHVVRLAWSTV